MEVLVGKGVYLYRTLYPTVKKTLTGLLADAGIFGQVDLAHAAAAQQV